MQNTWILLLFSCLSPFNGFPWSHWTNSETTVPYVICPEPTYQALSCSSSSCSFSSGSNDLLLDPYFLTCLSAGPLHVLCDLHVPSFAPLLVYLTPTSPLGFSWSDILREVFPDLLPISIRCLCCTFSEYLVFLFIEFIIILKYTFIHLITELKFYLY